MIGPKSNSTRAAGVLQHTDMTQNVVHIAVVDDDPPVRTALARLLSASGFIPVTYESANAFIDSLDDEIPECLIVDIHMPNMNGIELQMYLAYAGIKIPTIVITAQDDPDIRAQCYAAGAVAYLPKPLPDNGLIVAINDAMRGRDLPNSLS